MDDARFVALARTQHGLITRAQALDLGATVATIRHRLASGAWTRVAAATYVVGAWPRTWEQRIAAAVIVGGPEALASHRTAARLWGLVDRSGRPEIVVPQGERHSIPGVTVHRSKFLDPSDASRVSGIPVTSIPRTLIDSSPGQDELVVGTWVDRALRDDRLDLADLAACQGRLGGPGRPSIATLSEAIAVRHREVDLGQSALESRAIVALSHAGLPDPERQHLVVRPCGTKAYLDLAYPDVWLAIELDGWATHGGRDAFEADRQRSNDLAVLGWSVLRFTWRMTTAYLCATVERALQAQAPPQPPRVG